MIMILPRPIPIDFDYNQILNFLKNKFVGGEEFTLCGDSNTYILINLGYNVTVKVKNENHNKINTMKGILRFYINVTKDIGLINDKHNYLIEGNKVTVEQWLFSGIDGAVNIDKLCKLWIENDGLLPNKETEKGKELKKLFKEINNCTLDVKDEDESIRIMEFIDSHLFKYGSYLNDLALRSGLKLL